MRGYLQKYLHKFYESRKLAKDHKGYGSAATQLADNSDRSKGLVEPYVRTTRTIVKDYSDRTMYVKTTRTVVQDSRTVLYKKLKL
jgi:hypothetical protein